MSVETAQLHVIRVAVVEYTCVWECLSCGKRWWISDTDAALDHEREARGNQLDQS